MIHSTSTVTNKNSNSEDITSSHHGDDGQEQDPWAGSSHASRESRPSSCPQTATQGRLPTPPGAPSLPTTGSGGPSAHAISHNDSI